MLPLMATIHKRKVAIIIASTEKFTHNSMSNIIRHNNRTIINDANKDIDKTRRHLNYSISMEHDALTDYEYYKKIIGDNYLYGRGSSKEKDAITGCGWVITLPQELYGFPEKEQAFFKSAFDFVSNRYGKENIINNAIHYDEAGLPHIHILFCPITKLDHDIVQHKTIKTKKAIKLKSGRYEYQYQFKLDANGEKIKINNYAKMTEYYEKKISANDVLNKIELKNFHKDFQSYLIFNNIEGNVVTGKTGGVNFTVKELKDFTQKTGLNLNQVLELQNEKTLLESFVERNTKVTELEQVIQKKNIIIESLQGEILTKDLLIDKINLTEEIHNTTDSPNKFSHTLNNNKEDHIVSTEQIKDMEQRLKIMEHNLEEKQLELDKANEKIKVLESEKTIEVKPSEWGKSSSWGERSNSQWGTKNTEITEENLW